jgi:hypothetical protein
MYGWTVATNDNGVRPKTTAEAVDGRFVSIYLHVQPLRVLMNADSTLSERCRARFGMAITVGGCASPTPFTAVFG